MTKNIYLTILTLITCLCIVIGCWRYIFSADKNNNSITDTQSVDAFHTLMADTNVMDVIVTTGDTYSVSYTCKSNLTPEIIQKNDKLTIKQTKKSGFNWFFGGLSSSHNCEVTITVPAGEILDLLTIDSSVGDVQIADITAKNAEFDLSVGDIKIVRSNIDDCKFDCSTGDVELTSTTFASLDADISVGDVKISSDIDLDDYAFDIHTSVGDVKINGKNEGSSYSSKGDSNKKIKIDGSTGDVKIDY